MGFAPVPLLPLQCRKGCPVKSHLLLHASGGGTPTVGYTGYWSLQVIMCRIQSYWMNSKIQAPWTLQLYIECLTFSLTNIFDLRHHGSTDRGCKEGWCHITNETLIASPTLLNSFQFGGIIFATLSPHHCTVVYRCSTTDWYMTFLYTFGWQRTFDLMHNSEGRDTSS